MEKDDIAKLEAALRTTAGAGPEEQTAIGVGVGVGVSGRQKKCEKWKASASALRETRAANEAAVAAVDRLLQRATTALADCRQLQLKLQLQLQRAATDKSRNPTTFRYFRWPYFSDQNKFLPPDNEDTKSRRQLQLPDLMRLPPVYSWNLSHKHSLRRSITQQARKRAVTAASSNLKALQRQVADDEEIRAANEALTQAMSENTPLEQFVDPLSAPDTYDWDMVAADCPGRSGFECRAMWRVFLHPQINKSPWTATEVSQFKQQIEQMGPHRWDQIAKDLGTNRTAYQCFVYYKMFICRNQTAGVKWTPEEDLYVFNVVESCRVGDYIPWSKVAFYVENRSKLQIYNRWLHIYKYYKKGKFTREEGNVLESAAVLFGRDFKKISSYLPGRSEKAIASHYYTQLHRKSILNWTLAEDTLIVTISAKEPPNFQEMRKKLPNRSLLSIQRRYVFLTRWQKKHPKLPLSHVARSKTNPVTKIAAVMQFNDAIQAVCGASTDFLLPLPALKQIKSRRDVLDRQLCRYFQQLNNKQIESPKEPVHTKINDINPLQLKSALFLLGAKLNVNLFNSYRGSHKLTPSMQVLNDLLQSKPIIEMTKPSGIRTYSRKNKTVKAENVNTKAVSTIEMNIWQHDSGNSSVTSHFPPSVQTISTVRTLSLLKFNHVHSIAKRFIAEIIANNHINHHESLDLWVSRFEALFKWPLLLANIIPNPQLTMFLEDKNSPTLKPSEFEPEKDNLSKNNIDVTVSDKTPNIICRIEPMDQEISPVNPSEIIGSSLPKRSASKDNQRKQKIVKKNNKT
ncbi:proximal sequence element A Pbp95 [Arctopsyche grandis]|uniref:proximal sequence element A Pbp95 n=1 Tax=Arctopsyche grandis TaxID=121162 RepID=UPI00406D88EB